MIKSLKITKKEIISDYINGIRGIYCSGPFKEQFTKKDLTDFPYF